MITKDFLNNYIRAVFKRKEEPSAYIANCACRVPYFVTGGARNCFYCRAKNEQTERKNKMTDFKKERDLPGVKLLDGNYFDLYDWGVYSSEYKKKPVTIEALRLEVDVEIETLEGTMKGNIGDWLIKGVNGEFYPCKHEIFKKTYEKI